MKKICLVILLLLFCQQSFAMKTNSCPDDKPIKDGRGYCHTCEEEIGYHLGITKQECERCSNRYFSSTIFDECLFKVCHADKPIKTEEGKCHACDDTLAIENTSVEECLKCPNRKFDNGVCILSECPSTEPVRGHRGSCFECEPDYFWERISAEECAKCSGLGMVDGKCSFVDCPDDRPVRDLDGKCNSCDSLYSFVKVSAEECAKCPGKHLVNNRCILIDCPDDKSVRDLQGECRSCDFLPDSAELSESECNKCQNRIFKSNRCVLKECPVARPVRDKDGECYSCDDRNSFFVISAEECAKCSNRKMDNGLCISTKACPEEKPLRSSTGSCFSCDTELFVNFSKEECAKCPNREMDGEKCVLSVCPEGQIKDEDTGDCFKEKKLFIDKTIQIGNEPKWDYLEKNIKCSHKNGCVDKYNKKINGIVKEDMFDFYSTVSYRNGEPNGVTKFYTQQNEFIAQSNVKSKEDFSVPLGNENFRLMMEKVAREKHKVLTLVVYLDACKNNYSEGNKTCQEVLTDEKIPALVKGKTISIKKVRLKGKKDKYLRMDLSVLDKKYYSELRKRMLPSVQVKEENNHLILYYPD